MTWAWVITLQWRTDGGQLLANSTNGTLTPEQAAACGTRTAAFDRILAFARGHMSVPPGSVAVLFFSLEPDDLKATVREGL